MRTIVDEAKRLFVARSTAHVGAEERAWFAPLLPVPWAAFRDQVAIFDSTRICGLEVLPKSGMSRLEKVFRKIAVDDAKLRVEEWITIVVGVDHGRLEVARAGKNWAKISCRESTALCVRASKNKKLVVTRGDATLHAEEVGEHGVISAADRVPVVLSVRRVDGPLSGTDAPV